MLAPVILFCYNRPRHTEQTLLALSNNTLSAETPLFIFCDGPKKNATEEQMQKINAVRKIAKSKQWCGKVDILESDINKGLAGSIIYGVTKIINEYGSAIVLEDDLITSKYFLEYMNTALKKYENDEMVMQISGHQFPLWGWKRKQESFFLPFTTSWGWATWKRAWDKFDINASGYKDLSTNADMKYRFNLNGSYQYSDMLFMQMNTPSNNVIDSWAIKWWWSVFRCNGIVLFPDKTLVNNVGYGDEATHTVGEVEENEFKNNYHIKRFPSVAVAGNRFFENYLLERQKKQDKQNKYISKLLDLFRLRN